ncbi:MAG: molybdopterin-dependent oxidoreductase [Acidimicrobiaceae bacterium]|nr:molybdopterin-dependent oxidoreductase [Acidimicrobiaceae bacterium]MYJ41026.1 molybdopterin-dependent oxidoreductase [Acidimicrobiaceae bacterium]
MRDQESTGEHPGSSPDAVPSLMGALAGTAGAAVGLGFGELVEGASESIPSLVVAVSELLSDYTPGDVVRFSIANFGASQKTLLTAGIIAGSLVLGGVLGRFAARGRPGAMLAGFALFGLLGGWAAARNPISPAAGSWIVGLAAAALAAGTTLLLVGRLAEPAVRSPATLPVDPEQPEPAGDVAAPAGEVQARRAFFGFAVGAGAAALAMVGLGRALRGQSAAEQFLETNTLRSAATTTSVPPPTTEAAAAPGSTTTTTTAPAPVGPSVQEQVAALDTLDGDVAGVSSYVTPNDSFYRIDTAFGRVPQIDPANWRLRIGGMVDNPYELTFDEIQAMELSDHVITLSCVSNRVGGNLVGNAVWTGVPLSVLLDRAGVQAGADQVVGRSVDDWTAGFPTPLVYDGRNAILAIGMNDEFLPTNHGFPARLVVAGLYGYVSAVKWLDEIHLTTWDGFDGYWVPRGWSKEGPIKTQSRIDVPAAGRGLVAGQTTPIAGIAWAPTRGIERVEVNVDDEGWLPCRLGEALGDESWVQWHREWIPSEGRHRIQVRATDGDGITQSGEPVDPAPNGAEGWHTITVTVDA